MAMVICCPPRPCKHLQGSQTPSRALRTTILKQITKILTHFLDASLSAKSDCFWLIIYYVVFYWCRPVFQCVAGAMYITGFSESIAELLNFSNIWAVRGISFAVLLGLLGINLAGVKWIIRLQLLLLFLLAVSTLDFVIGSFTHLDPGKKKPWMLEIYNHCWVFYGSNISLFYL